MRNRVVVQKVESAVLSKRKTLVVLLGDPTIVLFYEYRDDLYIYSERWSVRRKETLQYSYHKSKERYY